MVIYENNIPYALVFVEGSYAKFYHKDLELEQSQITEYLYSNRQDPFSNQKLLKISN